MGFPGGSAGKESAHNAGDLGSIPGLGRSLGEGKGYTPVFWPENSMDCSLPGSSVHGILQARILEWVAISFSRGSNPGLPHCGQMLYHLSHQGSPHYIVNVKVLDK